MGKFDLKKLKASWTKYDSVKVINIIGNDELEIYLNDQEGIDLPVLKAYLGINNIEDPIPIYWKEVIKDYPKYRKMFTLLAGIFTHHENIELFSKQFKKVNMGGTFTLNDLGKHDTNLRSALVEGGAALNSFRRRAEVPYDFSSIFTQDEIGKLFKDLIIDRLKRIGYDGNTDHSFYEACFELGFHDVLSLNKQQFRNWLEGKSILKIKTFDYDLLTLKDEYQNISALKVDQWLSNWNDINFSLPLRSKPEPSFYVFSLDIRLLKRISDVHRRKAIKLRSEEINIQRSLKEERSLEIRNYVKSGFPLSTLTERDRNLQENDVLKMPGFLPTAILVNILGVDQKRGNSEINKDDLIKVEAASGRFANIILPEKVFSEDWAPELKPIEIIDGQHRLWAFDETEEINGSYEVPVIAYYNLDRAWQAYLFYVINIKPKKINTSLGYDLYPLLRTQEWLENSKEGLKVYRETRAQEIVEALWFYPESPWHRRINMLGEEGSNISQNAFVRALSDSFFRKVKKDISGLFGDVLKSKNFEELNWVRAQQAAFLILIWDEISHALTVDNTKPGDLEWVDTIRSESGQLNIYEKELKLDRAFTSKNSNLSRDQGVTGISLFANDFFYLLANTSDIDFNELIWDTEIDERQIDPDSIDIAISKFRNHSIFTYIQLFAGEVIKLDWRTSGAEFDDDQKRDIQKKYRGSGGYREIWNDLLKIFLQSKNEKVLKYADQLSKSV